MKNIFNKISIMLLTAATIFSGCTKNFLEKSPNNSLSPVVALGNISALQTALNGDYARLRSVSLYGRDIPVSGDLLADNAFVESKNSGRYLPQFNYSVINTDGIAFDIWNDGYNAILDANNIIDATVTGADAIKAQAYAIRALMYFKLVNVYAKPFTDDPTAMGVPIVLHYNPYNYPSRSSVKDVYTQIISDLQAGFKSAPVYTNSITLSKYAIEGLLARAYLYMGDYTNAKIAAVDVINNSGFTLVTPGIFNAFWSNPAAHADKVEVLYEVDADAINNNGFNDIAGIYINGYQDIYASSQLYNLYSAIDIRRTLYITGKTKSGAFAFLVNKYPNAQSNDRDNIKVIRLAEVYLIAAESSVTSSPSDAVKYLNALVAKRDPSFVGYNDAGAALLNDIVQERRKELAFEGDRLYDLNRLKLPVERVANSGSIPAGTANVNLKIPYPDNRRVYPIPLTEILANKNVVQNPGY